MGARLAGLAGIGLSLAVTVFMAHLFGVRRSPSLHAMAVRVDRVLPSWLSVVLGVELLLGTEEEELLWPWWRPAAVVAVVVFGIAALGFASFCLGFVLFGEQGW
jgi:hypothetical protein